MFHYVFLRIVFIHPSVSGCLSCFHPSALVNSGSRCIFSIPGFTPRRGPASPMADSGLVQTSASFPPPVETPGATSKGVHGATRGSLPPWDPAGLCFLCSLWLVGAGGDPAHRKQQPPAVQGLTRPERLVGSGSFPRAPGTAPELFY